MFRLLALLFIIPAQLAFCASSANRLTYLDEDDPFYPHLKFPKLTTPQWVREDGVEAVVILAIDDMRDTPKYEEMLRPILERLKKIDGRAPVSIMCNSLAVTNEHLQAWLKEGVSLEVHTLTHPCPLLAQSNFTAAADTYHRCVELMNNIPGNKAVAFRMPCCDSMNSPSPRFYAEIFNRVSSSGQFLTIDSSVMNITTANDKSLPRDVVFDADGRERFRKYLPAETNAATRVSMKSFVTTIEDYPYPYVIGRLCWQFPAMAPSDWESRNLQGDNNPKTIEDWKAALDATVIKQGTFSFIFHPHGWIRSSQMVEFLDYAISKYGKRVKFLNFREAQERIDKHLLAGNPLRAADGKDNGVRILDLNDDGYLDVLIGNQSTRKTRLWNAKTRAWTETEFPTSVDGVRFGIVRAAAKPVAFKGSLWEFDGQKWVEQRDLLKGLTIDGKPVMTVEDNRDRGVRFRDTDNDGQCELLVSNDKQNAVLGWSESEHTWKRLSYALPENTSIVDAEGQDAGLRFVDLNADGFDDVLFSDPARFSLHQFIAKANQRLNWKVGWNDQLFAGVRGQTHADIPPIVRSGPYRNNGVWFRSGHMWIQNEDTAHLPDKVDRRSFRQLLTAEQPQPKSPEDSLASIKVRDGFALELVAAEPLITDPVAFEWSADGRLWVVEMHDYPLGVDGKPAGRVRFLTDTNNDGRYDSSTIFVDGLLYPTGLYPWRKGVIIAAAPDLFYAEDTNGDGKADVRRVLFTGFTKGNPQHLVNGFDYGLEGWLYGANGDSGGSIMTGSGAQATTDIRGRDFRFQPDQLGFEAIEGQTQFGRHRDDWGNWFGNNNPTWVWHYYLPDRYLARNPQLAVKTTKQVLGGPEGTRCFPISRMMQRFNDHWQANHVTSGNSPTPYRDDFFGPDFATSVFISEPVHNLVHREVLEPDGITFKSRRAADETSSEFLASTDNWFRPTMLKTGPDGALYIADMYRLVIEHPEWITKDIQQRLDLRAGSDMGRIYRVYPKSNQPRKIPRLDVLDTKALVEVLKSPNGWQRDTAQRLLIERGDRAAIPLLRQSILSTSSTPLASLHALYTLNGLSALTLNDLILAWKHPHAGIREHGVRLSEGHAREIEQRLETAKGLPEFINLAKDPSVRVRYQLALSLGELGPRAGSLLAALANRDADQPAVQTAIMTSAPKHLDSMFKSITVGRDSIEPTPGVIEGVMKLAVAQGEETKAVKYLSQSATAGDAASFAAMAGLLDALAQKNLSFESLIQKHEAKSLDNLFDAARRAVSTDDCPESKKLAAIRLLGRDHKDLSRLSSLLGLQHSATLQRAAMDQLIKTRADHVGELLLEHWQHSSPNRKADILNALIGRPKWATTLLSAIEAGKVLPAEIGAAHQQKLKLISDDGIGERAQKLFTSVRTDRKALLKDYAKVGQINGEASRGALLYQQQCASCHRFKEQGTELGPDLGTVANKSVDALLVAILDPNEAIESRYINYLASTKDGRELNGIIISESANNITLRATGGTDETILRTDLQELKSTGLSLMPEGLENALPPPAMADLLAYILSP